MSVFIDTLAQIITQSVGDAEATREDWQQAVNQAFEVSELEPLRAQVYPTEYHLTWEIEQDGKSAVEAAITVWQEVFRRGPSQPAADSACVFTVVSQHDGTAEIDLSDPQFTHLFD